MDCCTRSGWVPTAGIILDFLKYLDLLSSEAKESLIESFIHNVSYLVYLFLKLKACAKKKGDVYKHVLN